METPRVLVAVPTYEGMKYCHNEFLGSVRKLTYPNKDILVVENSKGDQYFEELKKEPGIILLKDSTTEENKIKRLISSRNKIIGYALKNGYDYIFMLESDVITPKNIIEELLSCNKKIVSGLYNNVFNVSGQAQILPTAWKEFTEEEFTEIKDKIILPDFVKSREDLRRHLIKSEAESGKLLEVLIPSHGCMLMHRDVFESIRYRLIDTSNKGGVHTTDDIYFILEARKKGFKSFCYTKLKCNHLISKKYIKQGNHLKNPMFMDD